MKKCSNFKNNPKCKKIIKTRYSLLCRSCTLYGNTVSDETRKKMSKSQKGKNNAFYGRTHTKKSIDLMVKNHSGMKDKTHSKEAIEKMSKTKTGKRKSAYSQQAIENIRIAACESWRKKYGQRFPNYNSESIPIIEKYGKEYGYDFQHAENGGEICIGGYFPDGVDMDKKVIIEVDEQKHFDRNGNLKQKDVDRQEYLENLGYEIVRIKFEASYE